MHDMYMPFIFLLRSTNVFSIPNFDGNDDISLENKKEEEMIVENKKKEVNIQIEKKKESAQISKPNNK